MAAPDRTTWTGRRDHALLLTGVHTGLRVSELTGLRLQDVHLGTGAHLRCRGKGRKERCTPLTRHRQGPADLAARARWGESGDPLFPTRRGTRLSRDAVEQLVVKHATVAAARVPVAQREARHPAHAAALHRDGAAPRGVDVSVIALWLGHESTETTQIYLHADMSIKECALARTTLPGSPPGRYVAPDTLLAFLDTL